MAEQDLLTRLKSEIGPDLTPVRPLGAPGSRALWMLETWIVLGGGILVFGPRPDIGALGAWRSVGFSLVEVAVCFVLVVIGLRSSIPAMAGSRSSALVWMAGALAVHVLVAWGTLERSAMAPQPGDEWRTGLACGVGIAVLSLAPLGLGTVLLRRGLLTRPFLAFGLTGFTCGLAAEAAWRLHCEYSAWGHVLPFHLGALVFPLLVAFAAAVVVSRRA